MRILYISQYFPPEAGATQTRAFEMARNWVLLGHQVTMLTEFPNHPSGIMPKEYQGKLFERSNLEGIEVIRVWVKASPDKNFRTRMFFYLTFMVNSILAGLLLARGRYDFVYATSPPLFVGASALVLSWARHLPMVFEVRDLWPESAIALGELTDRRAISLASRLEQTFYRKANQVIVVTRGIYDSLAGRGIPAEKLTIIPNGANIELFTYKPASRERLRQELSLEGKYVAIYAGIHGLAQGLETILEAARLLLEDSRIHFLLVGDGPKKAELSAQAASYKLSNLTLLPEKPVELIPDYLSAADVALVPLKKREVFKGVLPSKLFDAWACERPVILSIDGEARMLVESVGGGLFVPPEEPDKIAESLIYMLRSPEEGRMMGKKGREYTVANNSRSILAKKLIEQLQHNLQKPNPSSHQ